MLLREAINKLLRDNNKTKTWLAEKMGYARPNGITCILARGNIELNTLCRICEIMDYEVTIQPKRKTGARPNGQIVLEGAVKEK